MKRMIALFLSVLLAWNVYAQEYTRYLTVDQMPDLVKCLPAPPKEDSPAFQYDKERYKWGVEQRNDAERAAMVKADAVWSFEALLGQMSPAFGLAISQENTPEIWKLMVSSLSTVDPMRVEPKAYYKRIRPFMYFNEPTLTGEDDDLRGEGSYPSGHTMRGWLSGLLLAEVNPARANEIFARAWIYCENRVIAGAHWQSDVDVTRVAASICYNALQGSPAFREQMEKAKEEFRKLNGKAY